jgi:DNA/RNA endonuclease YhcR with UshA esterase domain
MNPLNRFVFALPLISAGLLVIPALAADPPGRAAMLERPRATGIAPDEALSHVGKRVTVEFVVKGGRKLDDREICFLNSKQDYRQPGTFTAVIFRDGLARFAADGVANPGAAFLGKTIRVSGTVEDRSGQAQIVVESPTQIEVIEGVDPVSPDDQNR